jgi:hypothetical protein
MSAKSTVSWRRSPSPGGAGVPLPAWGCGAAVVAGTLPNDAPHSPQNRACRVASAPQPGHFLSKATPQLAQNRCPSCAGALQLAHFMIGSAP